MIYLDNAATTIDKPPEVAEAMIRALKNCGNAGRGANEASLEAARVLYQARCRLASLLNAEDESTIVFTANATEALNLAIKGTLKAGDFAVTTVSEHNSVLRPLYDAQNRLENIKILLADTDDAGVLDYKRMETMIRESLGQDSFETETGLEREAVRGIIVCTHASNVTGNLTDLERVGCLAKRYRLLFIVDASQTVGHLEVDVQKSGVDILCFTGHKELLGPQGTGGMYVRKGISISPLLQGGTGVKSFLETMPEEMPEHLEAGTRNLPGIAGLSAAADYIGRVGFAEIRQREQKLMNLFLDKIHAIPGITCYGDFSDLKQRVGIVSINVEGAASTEVEQFLGENGVAVRAGIHCAPLLHKKFGTETRGMVRFSFSHRNTAEEVCRAAELLQEFVNL